MFDIPPVSHASDKDIQRKIDTKTKPPSALGLLELLAMQIARVLGKDNPIIVKPQMLVFAADHGVSQEGISIASNEVTQQMVMNFISGGAAINVFCHQVGFALEVIDCGILSPLASWPSLVQQRLGEGTQPFHRTKAMSIETVFKGFELASQRVEFHYQQGCNLIAFGEMGIGNTASSSAIMASVLKMTAKECVGRGTGIDDEKFARKIQIVEQGLALHKKDLTDIYHVLACVGGFEIVQMTGAILAAAQRKMLVVVDGFIATVAALSAIQINENARDYMIFAHQSHEQGHKRLLDHLGAKPLLNLDMRLGEGSGAALALPLIQAASNFYNQMASLTDLGIKID
ncbi:nicotinate-nucleotide--dimethylbenzimidazole phosphoribosyltransferase [uncultured Shewanella sp.]|uniref:nicotinate-nucleotide--dimethylbenzimidazole phosphoribosyltransferase n=1 Tax=uncultured Shewanella sp. TaxID=173975 RepID=UPI0026055542|nr:nicotinate-nucleotide--dimethylbenzimidazole phosphoribosyltransferase [uncultured Shewanella sp.]